MLSPSQIDKLKYVREQCQLGKYVPELKELYLAPIRDKVPWALFPAWARPNDYTEGAHEG
jgi:hypothetical protein